MAFKKGDSVRAARDLNKGTAFFVPKGTRGKIVDLRRTRGLFTGWKYDVKFDTKRTTYPLSEDEITR